MRVSVEPNKRRLGLLDLFISEPRGGDSDTGLALHRADFENLPFRLGFGARGKVFAHAPTVQPAANPKNNFPGGIFEL